MTKFMISGPLGPGRVRVSESSLKNISEKHIKNVLFCEHVYDFVLMILFIFFYIFFEWKNMFFV